MHVTALVLSKIKTWSVVSSQPGQWIHCAKTRRWEAEEVGFFRASLSLSGESCTLAGLWAHFHLLNKAMLCYVVAWRSKFGWPLDHPCLSSQTSDYNLVFPVYLPPKKVLTTESWQLKSLAVIHFFFKDCIYLFERDRERDSKRESPSRGEKEKKAPPWVESLTWGWIPGPQDHDLSWRQTLNWLSHADALTVIFLWIINTLAFSQALSTKCETKWNFRIVEEILDGLYSLTRHCLQGSMSWVPPVLSRELFISFFLKM